MIKKLILKNFQSHKHSELNLHPGVNCIVGSSDVGKTALVRALRWLIWNRPTGDDFRSEWGGKTAVTVITEDNTIRRIKDTNKNVYVINGQQLKAIRTDVPEEVTRALNIDEINVQRQFDRPFLLDDSAGEVAAHFNRIAHLNTIDSSIKNVQSWLRQIQQEIDADTVTIKDLKEQLKKYAGLDTLDQQVQRLENLDSELKKKKADLETLSTLVSNVVTTKRGIVRLERLTKLADLVEEVLSRIKAREETQLKLSSLRREILNVRQVQHQLTKASENIVTLKGQFVKEFPSRCPLCSQKVRREIKIC